jgi:hypothetical protein
MRILICILLIVVWSIELSGQTVPANLPGKVSFISSQNIYVKFRSTEGISVGDTLFMLSGSNMIPVLKVTGLSSTSCVCTPIPGSNPPIATEVMARKRTIKTKPEEKAAKDIISSQVQVLPVDTVKKKPYPDGLKQRINGSISAYSYFNFSNNSASNSYRFRYNLSMDARNIGNSKFSLETYISFNHKLGDWAEVRSDIFNALKIYNLAVRYDLNKTTLITIGRKLNPKISSMGSMDGLQFEKSVNRFAFGALAGFRPDYKNYGFNSKLFQYGGYVAYSTRTASNYSESSLAFVEQMNNWKTDRRFIYFQHSNCLIKNIYFFGTFEMDLFRLKNGLPQNTLDLTGLYLSLTYRIANIFTITGSYDERKNIMYYETYKTIIDSILINEMRQSYRLRINYRITKDLILGVESGYRYLKTDTRPSKNINSYLTYTQIPGANISVTLSGTYMESNYMKGKILGASISRDFLRGKFQSGLGYHYVDYSLPENQQAVIQHTGELNLYWQISRSITFSANYEATFQQNEKYHRVYLQVRKRF